MIRPVDKVRMIEDIVSAHLVGNRNKPPISMTDTAGLPEKQSQEEIQKQSEILIARSRAIAASLLHKGKEEPLDIVDYVQNPNTIIPSYLFNYVVPQGMIAMINRVGVIYSEPIISMTESVGWRLTVNGSSPPNILYGQSNYYWHSLGSLERPMEIEPLWCQSGELIRVEISALAALFNERLCVTGRISGRLYQPASPLIYEVP